MVSTKNALLILLGIFVVMNVGFIMGGFFTLMVANKTEQMFEVMRGSGIVSNVPKNFSEGVSIGIAVTVLVIIAASLSLLLLAKENPYFRYFGILSSAIYLVYFVYWHGFLVLSPYFFAALLSVVILVIMLLSWEGRLKLE